MSSDPYEYDMQMIAPLLNSLPLGDEVPCGYFEGRMSKNRYFIAGPEIPEGMVHQALLQGFRRCGATWFQPHCNGCNLCLNFRLDIERFEPSRNQKRVLKKNEDLEVRIVSPNCTIEKEKLYLKYQYSRHDSVIEHEHDLELDTKRKLEAMQRQMYQVIEGTKEIEIYHNEQLIGFGVFDTAVDVISLIYFVFDTDFQKRSLGTFNILSSIQWAKENGFKYVLLGHYIPGHPKMKYKRLFQPGEFQDPESRDWIETLPKLIFPEQGESKERKS